MIASAPSGAKAPARHVIVVGSGKGGVGKSTVSLNLALALCARGSSVGVLDADFYGPDIPLMVGLTRTKPLGRWSLWQRGEIENGRLEPVERYGLRLMSVGFLLAENQALPWPAEMLPFVARQLISDVDWGPLDYLVVDLPPGTADLQRDLLKVASVSGAIVVVGPQDVSHLDAKKVLAMLEDARVAVLGAVENMAAAPCPHCGAKVAVFPAVRDARSIWALGVDRLGSIPLDAALAHAGDHGVPLLVQEPGSSHGDAFAAIAAAVVRRLDETDQRAAV